MPSTASTPIERRAHLDQTAALLLVVLCASWGLFQVSAKVANGGISPVLQSGLRAIGSTALLLAWSHWRGIPLWQRDGTLAWGLAVGLLFAFEFMLIYGGLARTQVSRGTLFLYAAPFVVAIGAHLFVPGDRLTRMKAAGLAAAFAGLAIVLADGLRRPTGAELAGDLMCLLAAVSWGATTIMIKASPLARCSPEKTLLYQLGVAALISPPVSLLLGEAGVFDPSMLVLAALAYQVVIVAFVTYLAWFWLVTRYPATNLAAFTFLSPAFGVLFGGVLLGEPIGPELIAAATLIALGIYLVNRPGRRPDPG